MSVEVAIGLVVIVLLAAACVWLWVRHREIRQRYSGILDVDAAIAKAGSELQALRARAERERAELSKQTAELLTHNEVTKATYARLAKELALLEENLEDISFGVYKPHFEFTSSAQYKAKLTEVNERQKQMIRNGQAVNDSTPWFVGGSRAEGQRMQKQYGKLMLRAFNGECDAAIARVSWNNIARMEERISKAFDAINQLGTVMKIRLNAPYLALKLEELRLEFELEDKKHQEAEEQRELREQMREEEKAQREFERMQKEAEDEEARYQKALDKARKEVAKARGDELAALNEKIAKIEASLAEARKNKERAISRAQQTRSGHVYVISNVGSFGESVFKIGMTRRLDPQDRVRELGDASVPFSFDVHAMFYTEDAPALENALHKHFNAKRVNLVNGRKEFFRVSYDELEEFAKAKDHKMEFTKLAEAREYRESIALRGQGPSGRAEVGNWSADRP